MKQFKLVLVFAICLLLLLIGPIFAPSYRLTFFAPFIVIAYYQKSFEQSLWLAFLCGAIMDLLSPLPRLGLYAMNFCLVTCVLYSKKQHFFEDRLTTLPFMTFLFSILSTLLHAAIITVFVGGIDFSWSWALTDLLVLPGADAAFAFACFNLPLLCFRKRPLRGEDYFSR